MILKVKKTTYKQVLEYLDSSAPKKIAAIKAVRADAKCGLREAKEAVEHLAFVKGFSNHPTKTDEYKIYTGPTIKKLVVDYGTGDIEVDVETMELRALMEMQTIGLDACVDILDLISVLKAFDEGKRVGVIEENE